MGERAARKQLALLQTTVAELPQGNGAPASPASRQALAAVARAVAAMLATTER